LPPALIGGAISAGTSLLGGLLGSSAASKAAAQQAAAGTAAAAGQRQAGNVASGQQQQQLSSETANASPYTTLGAGTAGTLSSALAPGGSLGSRWSSTFSAPTAAQAEQTPGYQFQLQQGLNALQNSAAARGGLLSTGTAKNLNNYAQGTASANYQNTYNNALQAYNTNFSTNEQSQNDLFNRLYSTTGLGANSAANLNSVRAGTTNALASGEMGNAQIVGNDIRGVGEAQASGTVGSANALNAGITGVGNAIGQGISLQGLLGAMNASNSNQVPDSPSGSDMTTGNALMNSGMFGVTNPINSDLTNQTTSYGRAG
jgi:hypothetical protein